MKQSQQNFEGEGTIIYSDVADAVVSDIEQVREQSFALNRDMCDLSDAFGDSPSNTFRKRFFYTWLGIQLGRSMYSVEQSKKRCGSYPVSVDLRADESSEEFAEVKQLPQKIEPEGGETIPETVQTIPIKPKPIKPKARRPIELDEDGLPLGFVESIQALEEKLRHPPPHIEKMRLLYKRGGRKESL